MILAIDPGKEKCGLAVLDQNAKVLERETIGRGELSNQVQRLAAKYHLPTIVIGRSSFGKTAERELLKLELKVHFVFIPEKDSTVEARRRYWRENRPRGLWKLVPAGLRVPPRPVDDYAAVILGERYLKR
jgi:RNase H-fold protein (predicted Holliday junction resolvase)